jgi:hypothetical protein
VLHFVGHGDYDVQTDEGILALVGADGRADLVDARRLADLLGEAQPTPQLVVMNSCSSGQTGVNDLFSGTAATLARCGISAVAAMQFSISDSAAIAFARGFYTAIAHGRDVDEAARSGRISILGAHGSLEWVTPVLYVRGQARQLFNLSTPRADRSEGPAPRQIPLRHESLPVAQSPARGQLARLVTAGRSALRRHRGRAAVIGAALAAIAAGFLVFLLVRPAASHRGAVSGWPSALGATEPFSCAQQDGR